MSFLTPLAFIGAAIAIPIILLYMLRLRRREVIVSSNFLWQQILQDREANTPWQRLKRNILMLLQLLILALLVLTLARPFVTVPAVTAGKTIILLDASASMNATDVEGTSRFEQARQEALSIVNAMGPSDSMAVIRVAEIAEPLTAYTSNIGELRGALESAEPGLGRGDWETALILAAAGNAGAENFNVVIISDGGIDQNVTLAQNIPAPIFIPVGEAADNVAITALATRPVPESSPQLFAQITNYGDQEAEVSLVIRLDGVLWDSRNRTVASRNQQSLVFDVDEPFTTVEAEILIEGETVDYLAGDNSAWAVAGSASTRRVLLLSEENIFLEQVLRSLPGLQIFQGDTSRVTLPSQQYDLYVFNGWLPSRLPDADMLIINPPNSTDLFTIGEETTDTANITVTNREDDRMAFVTLDNISLRAFKPVTNTPWAETLVQAEGGPLLLAGEYNGHQVAVITFDIRDSNLPLDIAWPVMISNLVEWFTPSDIISAPDLLTVGDSIEIRPPLAANAIRITAPDDTIHNFDVVSETQIFADTHQPGLYTLDILNEGEILEQLPFAVNLFATGESNIEPVENVDLGGGVVDTSAREQLGQREFWPIIAFLALLVLAIEWYVYHRRMHVPTILTPVRERR